MRSDHLLLFVAALPATSLAAPDVSEDALAEHDRLLEAVRTAANAAKTDEAFETLKKARQMVAGLQADDVVAAALCLKARRLDGARAEVELAKGRGPIDPFEIGAELAILAGPSSALAVLKSEDVRAMLVDVLGEEAYPETLLGTGGRTRRNSIGMDLVRIPSGKFTTRSDWGIRRDVVLTHAFFLGVTEVTQAQWKAVMGNNPSSWRGDDRPVHNVTWEDARRFCEKLSEKEGKEYRLPTEAEWEYACRGGSGAGRYGPLRDIAWYGGNCGAPCTVARKAPNRYGLYDMLGNALEWCSDWDGSYPSAGRDPTGAPRGTSRVLRGGSWRYRSPRFLYAGERFSAPPRNSNDGIGFRVAMAR